MSRRRRIVSGLLRWGFVAAVIAFAIVGFSDDWPSIVASIVSIPWSSLTLALVLTALGTVASIPVWRGLLSGLGYRLPWAPASRILLVGQLGKYIPGAVWSVGAQARLASPYGVSLRPALSTSAVYIGYHLAGAVGVAAIGFLAGWISVPAPEWAGVVAPLSAAALLGVVALFLPVVSRRLIGALARMPARVTWRAVLVAAALSALSWACWGAAIAALAGSSVPDSDVFVYLGAAVAAYALAYAAGLVVIIAPAGFGVREAVLVALLAPVFGLAEAAAVAVVGRLVSAIVDFGLALAAQLWDRSPRVSPAPLSDPDLGS